MPAIFTKRLASRAVMAVMVTAITLAGTAAQAASLSSTTSPCPTATTVDAGCSLSISAPAAAGSTAKAAANAVTSAATTTPNGLSPANLQQAYNLQGSTSGSGQTVAVVTPYDDPSAASDLAAYRSQYGLSPCTVANGCFKQVSQTGTSTLPSTSATWDATEAASIDTISAICPNCHILVIEATSVAITDLGTAENEAVSLGAKFIDNDWFIYESSGETSYDTSYFNHPGVAITAPSGDSTGYGVTYPAASPDVMAVGGTTLTADSSSPRGYDEAAWTNSGSGCSQYETKPSWQTDTGCATRTLNDLSADAGTPVAFYDTPTEAGWGTASGTDISSAIIAATYALAGTPGSSDNPAEYPYEHPGGAYTSPGSAYTSADGLNNITTGSDGSCSVTYLCTAGAGYNGPTGLGTPATAVSLTKAGGQSGAFYNGTAGICMDDRGSGTAAGTSIQDWACNGGGAQNWTAEPDGTLRSSIGSGNCAAAASDGTSAGTLIELEPCSASDSGQQWSPQSNREIINPASGLCLDNSHGSANGGQLTIDACDNSADEHWILPYSRPAATGSTKSKISSSKCVDDANDSTANGNKIQIWDCLSNANQSWDIQPNGTIQLHGQSGCIAASADGVASGTNLVYYTCNGDPSETWVEHSDGSLVNVRSGICFTDPSANTDNGVQLQLSTCNGSTQQTWTLP